MNNSAELGGHEFPSVIFLVGFMGSGKTTVGRALAAHIGYDFHDLDEIVEHRTGKSVSEIFTESGESEFRRLEVEAIQTCSNLSRAVVALGGGAYVADSNRAMVRSLGKTVWLNCSLEKCLARIAGDSSRPLLRGDDQMKALFESRRHAYAAADFMIDAGIGPPEQVASEVVRLLSSKESDCRL